MIRIARAGHTCESCGGEIRPGDTYEHAAVRRKHRHTAGSHQGSASWHSSAICRRCLANQAVDGQACILGVMHPDYTDGEIGVVLESLVGLPVRLVRGRWEVVE